ncbi:hypothetical protein JW835_01600 [bacterium]|nr:hypothetical protein [bacterium]
MDVKIENIIEKLRKEGVEGAQKESDNILAKAKQQAEDIVAKAEKEAEKIVGNAKREANAFQENSKLAIQQAARDGELLLKERIRFLFDQVFKAEVDEAMKPDFIQTLIIKLTEHWRKSEEVEVTISEAEQRQLEKHFLNGLKKIIKNEITLKASPNFTHGFRIGLKGEDVYYDFSDESIAEMLRAALNPRLKEILDTQHG